MFPNVFCPFVKAQWEILIRYIQKVFKWNERREKKKKHHEEVKNIACQSYSFTLCYFFIVRIYKMKLIYVETWREEAPLHTNLIFLMDSHDYTSVYTSTKQQSYIHLFLYILQTILLLNHAKTFFWPYKKIFISWKDTFWYRSFQ